MNNPDSITFLPTGTLLHGEHYDYRIERVLGQGSFGITYLASISLKGSLGQLPTKTYVAIKEFYMRNLSKREGSTLLYDSQAGLAETYRRKFQHEAMNLSKLDHPGIVKVMEAIEENSTAYYVMEHIDGPSLDSLIHRRGRLSADECVTLIRAVGSAVSYMHSRAMLHLDLKPGNIMLRSDGTPVVIDFGLSKSLADDGTIDTKSSIGSGTSGYSPIEQSDYTGALASGLFPATMDVYALGATMYKILTGQRPPEASIVLNEGLPDIADCGNLLPIIEKAMEPIIRRRYQSVAELLAQLPESPLTRISIDSADDSASSSTESTPVRESTPALEPTSRPPFINGLYAWDRLSISAFIRSVSHNLLYFESLYFETLKAIGRTALSLDFKPKNLVVVTFKDHADTLHPKSRSINLRIKTKSSDGIPYSLRQEVARHAHLFQENPEEYSGLWNAAMHITLSSDFAPNDTKELQAGITNPRDVTRLLALPPVRTLLYSAFNQIPNKSLIISPRKAFAIKINYSLTITGTGPTPSMSCKITPTNVDYTYAIGFGKLISNKQYDITPDQFATFCRKLSEKTNQIPQIPFPVTGQYPANCLEIAIYSDNEDPSSDARMPEPITLWRIEADNDPEYGQTNFPLIGGNLRTDIHQLAAYLNEIIPPESEKPKKSGWRRLF